MIVAFLGKAGVGKDTAADYLCRKYQFVKIAFADPMKRFCKEIFDFTNEQLWGPSEMRNKPDERYIRDVVAAGGQPTGKFIPEYLTPRFALQTLGTEWGRNCYQHVWVDYAMRLAKELLNDPSISYTAEAGPHCEDKPPRRGSKLVRGVVISDARFKNELSRIREQGAKVVQLLRPGVEELSAGVKGHASETEQNEVTAEDVDMILRVPEGHQQFYAALDEMIQGLSVLTAIDKIEKGKEG
jgi:hypothetical protein